MPVRLPSYAVCLLVVTALVVFLGASPAQLVERQGREGFAQRWWPAHATLHVPRAVSPHEHAVPGRVDTHRVFLMASAKGPIPVAPLSIVRDHERLEIQLHDNRRVWVRVPRVEPDYDAPLVALGWEGERPAAGVPTLEWSRSPELGMGRHAWTLERPFGLGPEGAPLAPLLVDTSLGQRAPRPLDRYWTVTLRGSVGAPLLDANGRILCVVFRPFAYPPATGLCATEQVAFEELGP